MKQKLSIIAVAVTIVATFFLSCKDRGQNHTKETQIIENEKVEYTSSKKECEDVHWSHHKGEDGPKNWENLCDGFSDCGGNAQSPINIELKNISKKNSLIAPKFSYEKSKVAIINNLHTIQFNISGDNNVTLNGKEYKLLQFHYHTLSEHTIDGNYFPIEVHFVHKYSNNNFAVLGVMFEEGKENDLFKKYLNKFPTTKGKFKSDDLIDLLNLLPSNKSYYNYKGSLTTPPCSEVVNWYILKSPLTASKNQIKQLSKILNNNYRPTLPLNGRTVNVYNE